MAEELPEPAEPERPSADGTISILESPVASPQSSESSSDAATASAVEQQPEQQPEQQTQPGEAGEPYEVLARGPVHEAFAIHPTASEILAPMTVEQAPPEPIDEVPPEQVPEGKDIGWVPGYWAWSDDADAFVWVTGFYREIPPGRQWEPGYWSQSGAAYRWTHGYWSSKQALDTARYLPQPPKSLENGPKAPPPNDDSFWMPGHWNFVDGEYAWESGFWSPRHAQWIWQPACYVASPKGYIFVSGYWDYEPVVRGTLSAPILFRADIYRAPGFRVRAFYPISRPATVLMHLFARNGYRCYFFGDFYDARYAAAGYRPWYRSAKPNLSSVSMLSYYQWKYHREGLAFYDVMLGYHEFFEATPAARPAMRLPIASSGGNRIGRGCDRSLRTHLRRGRASAGIDDWFISVGTQPRWSRHESLPALIECPTPEFNGDASVAQPDGRSSIQSVGQQRIAAVAGGKSAWLLVGTKPAVSAFIRNVSHGQWAGRRSGFANADCSP